jgi:hypothetical protein
MIFTGVLLAVAIGGGALVGLIYGVCGHLEADDGAPIAVASTGPRAVGG